MYYNNYLLHPYIGLLEFQNTQESIQTRYCLARLSYIGLQCISQF